MAKITSFVGALNIRDEYKYLSLAQPVSSKEEGEKERLVSHQINAITRQAIQELEDDVGVDKIKSYETIEEMVRAFGF